MATRIVPNLETVERIIDEVDEWYGCVHKIRLKMDQVKRGSEAYQDLLADLSVELDWLKMKAESAADTIDEYQESLPEDDSRQPSCRRHP
jgi:hypothetical protein